VQLRQASGRARRARVGDRLEHLVVDDDPLHGPPRGLRVVGGDDRDRLALVADLVDGQHRLVGGARGRTDFSPGTSSWVSTAYTPGSFSASVMSMPTIRAYGCGLRSVAPHSMSSCPQVGGVGELAA
jgi:hypothetical protein